MTYWITLWSKSTPSASLSVGLWQAHDLVLRVQSKVKGTSLKKHLEDSKKPVHPLFLWNSMLNIQPLKEQLLTLQHVKATSLLDCSGWSLKKVTQISTCHYNSRKKTISISQKILTAKLNYFLSRSTAQWSSFFACGKEITTAEIMPDEMFDFFFLSLFYSFFFFSKRGYRSRNKICLCCTAFSLHRLPFLCEQSLLCWVSLCLHGCAEGMDGSSGRKVQRVACAVYNILQGVTTSLFSGCSSIPSTVKSNFSLEENKKPCGISCKCLFYVIWRNMKELRISDYFSKLEIVLVLRRVALSLLSVTQGQI